jgi:hypothetical protein
VTDQLLSPVVDAIRDMIDLPDGFTADDSLAQPAAPYTPNSLAAWALRATMVPDGSGPGDTVTFWVRLAYAVDNGGEENEQIRDRDVSLALDAGVALIRSTVADNRENEGLWEWLAVESAAYDIYESFTSRAAWVDLTGWFTTST